VYSCGKSVIFPYNQTKHMKLFEVYHTHGSDYEEYSFLGCGVLKSNHKLYIYVRHNIFIAFQHLLF